MDSECVFELIERNTMAPRKYTGFITEHFSKFIFVGLKLKKER